MNFLTEFKPWFMKAGDDSRYYMEKGRCKERTVTAESGKYKPASRGKLMRVELPLEDRHIKLD